MIRITLLTLALVACACGMHLPVPGERVINGADASAGDYPWQVSLQQTASTSSGYHHFCGGSLISTTWVLTAAHCHMAARLVTVYVGSVNRFEDGTRFGVDQFIADPTYNSNQISNDFALIQLDGAVDTNNANIAIIGLPATQNTATEYSGSATVSGWGYDYYGPIASSTPETLQYANLPILSDEQCRSAWGLNYRPASMLCAGSNGQSACMGDSGGPFAQNVNGVYTLIGAVSWGSSQCTTSSPSVFAKITSRRDWIESTTGI